MGGFAVTVGGTGSADLAGSIDCLVDLEIQRNMMRVVVRRLPMAEHHRLMEAACHEKTGLAVRIGRVIVARKLGRFAALARASRMERQGWKRHIGWLVVREKLGYVDS